MINWPALSHFASKRVSYLDSHHSHVFHILPRHLFSLFSIPLWPRNVRFQKRMWARGTAGLNTDSLLWLMLHESATHCRHKKIQLHALWFIKTSKESLSPFIDLPGAFSCLSTWSWQMDQNSFPWKIESVGRLSGMLFYQLCCTVRHDLYDQYCNGDISGS